MRGRRISPFIDTLYNLLKDNRHEDIISWDKNGRSFTVYNLRRFESEILHQFFRNKITSSFFRQLNLYSFDRLSDGRKYRNRPQSEITTFGHENFIRDEPQLLPGINRKSLAQKSSIISYESPYYATPMRICITSTTLTIKHTHAKSTKSHYSISEEPIIKPKTVTSFDIASLL